MKEKYEWVFFFWTQCMYAWRDAVIFHWLTVVSCFNVFRTVREESIAEFELSNKNYPPLLFSRVKSFSAVSSAPLRWPCLHPLTRRLIITLECWNVHSTFHLYRDQWSRNVDVQRNHVVISMTSCRSDCYRPVDVTFTICNRFPKSVDPVGFGSSRSRLNWEIYMYMNEKLCEVMANECGFGLDVWISRLQYHVVVISKSFAYMYTQSKFKLMGQKTNLLFNRKRKPHPWQYAEHASYDHAILTCGLFLLYHTENTLVALYCNMAPYSM